MKPKDLFRYGCTNLFRRKTRTALTALSMAVGVMCIVVLISALLVLVLGIWPQPLISIVQLATPLM